MSNGCRKTSGKLGVWPLAGLAVLSTVILVVGQGVLSPSGQFAADTAMNAARQGAAAATLADGRILITGGLDSNGNPLASAEFLGSGSTAGTMTTPRTGHIAVALQDGRVLVSGGRTSGGAVTNTAEVFDPSAGSWTTIAAMLVARAGATATLLADGRVLITGGDGSGSPLQTTEIFDPASGQFNNGAPLTTVRRNHAAALLADGRVVIAGGSNGSQALASMDIYDPTTGLVSGFGSMTTPREGLSATTLLDGKVLLAGGGSASTEILDPATGAVAAGPAMSVSRTGHLAQLLPNNNTVLVAGGTTASAAAEIFVEWQNQFQPFGNLSSARSGIGGGASTQSATARIAGGADSSGTVSNAVDKVRFPMVMTDKADYSPGTTVNITGSGFQPGETVSLILTEFPNLDTHTISPVVADAVGNISSSEFAPDDHDVGIRFYLTATGASGLTAEATFTDNNVTVLSAPAGTTFTLTWTAFSTNCTGTIQNGPVNVSGIGSVDNGGNPGHNIGIGNPNSLSLQAAAFSDQGGEFQKWTLGSTNTPSNPVCVTSPSGTYTATYSTVVVAPTLSSVSPTSGILGTTASLILTGTNFANDATVSFSGTGITVNTTTVNSSTQITAAVTIATAASTLGGHNVSVTNPVPSGFTGGGTSTLTSGFTVNKRTTSTVVALSPTSVGAGGSSTVTVTVTDTSSGTTSNPAGTIALTSSDTGTNGDTFSTCTLANSGGSAATCTATVTTHELGTSPHTITATFTPTDAVHLSSSGTASLTVTQVTTSTTVTSSANISTYGQPVTFTATVTPSSVPAGGTVTFMDGATTLGTGTLNASQKASFSTSTLSATASPHSIAAVYAGVTGFVGSTSAALPQVVNQKALTATGLTAANKTYSSTTAATLTGTASLQAGEAFGSGTGIDGKPYTGDDVSITGTPVGTFASKNVANGITVNIAGLSLSGTAADNYTLTALTSTANITPKVLTQTGLTAGNKTYDATTAAILSGTAALLAAEAPGAGNISDGIPYTGDTVAVTGTPTGTFVTKDVANGITVNITGLSLTGAQAANYTLTTPTSMANITAKALTASGLTAANKVYDATTGATLSGNAALQAAEAAGAGNTTDGKPYTSDTVGVTGTPTGTFASKDAANGITVNITGLSLTGAQGGNYTLTAPTAAANITAKTLTASGLTANNKIYDATTVASLSGTAVLQVAEAPGAGTSSDAKPYTGDAVSTTGTPTGTFASKNVANGITVNISGLSLTGAQAGDYTLTAPASSANITALAITGSITANSKVYDGTAAATILTRTLSGVLGSDVVTYTGGTATFADKNVGSAKIVTGTGLSLSGADAANYSVNSTASTTASITKATLTITAATNAKVYDATTIAAATPTYTGLQSGDTLTGLAETYTDPNVAIGKTLTVSGSFALSDGNSGGNYTVSLVNNTTGVITQFTPGVTQTGPPASTYGQSVTLSVNVSSPTGGIPGGSVTFSYVLNSTTYYVCPDGSISTSTCSVPVTLNGGSYGASVTTNKLPPMTDPVTAMYSGDTNFTGATSNTVSVTVSKADTATTLMKAPDPSIYGDSVMLTVKVQDNTPGSTALPMGTAALWFQLDPTAPNPTTYYICADGSIQTAPCATGIALAQDATDLTGKTAVATVTTTKLPAGLSATSFVYAINASYSGDMNFNASGPFGLSQTVNQRPITVTAATDTKTYDGSTSSTKVPAITSGSLASGDSATWTQTYDSRNIASRNLIPAGTVSDGNGGNNYIVTFVNATGSISARPITVTAAASSKQYDGGTTSTATPTLTAGTVASGDNFGMWTETYDNKNVGTTHVMTPAGAVNDGNSGANYEVTLTTINTGIITTRPITVTAAASSKIYDGDTNSTSTPAITSGNLAAGDTAAWTETYDTRNVGSTHVMTPAGTVNDTNGGANYTVTFSPISTGVITARPITVTAAASSKQYDGGNTSTATPTLTAGTLATGDSFGTWTETYDNKNVGTTHVMTPGGAVNDGNSGANYEVTLTTINTGIITTRPITVTAVASSKQYDGGNTSTATPTLTAGTLATGDSFGTWTETYDNKNVGTTHVMTPAGGVNDGNSGANYAVTLITINTGIITTRPITVTAAASNKTYDGDTSSTSTPTITSGSLVASDTAAWTETYNNKNVGTTHVMTPIGTVSDGNSGANYAVTFNTISTGVITARPITVTAAASTKTYDGDISSTSTPTITSGSLAANDTATWKETYDNKNAGTTHVMTPTGVVSDGNGGANYAVTLAAISTGVINPFAIAANITASDKTYDSYTAATIANCALTGVLAADAGNVNCTASGATFASRNAGVNPQTVTAAVALGGAAAPNYSIISPVTTTAKINPAPLTITAVTNTKTYNGTTGAAVMPTVSGLQGSDTATGLAETYADKNVGMGKTLSVSAYTVNDGNSGGNYALTKVPNTTGVINKATLTITATGIDKPYDGTTAATVALSDNRVSGDVFTDSSTSASFADPFVGSGKTVTVNGILISGTDAANYSSNTSATTTATITASMTKTVLLSTLVTPPNNPANLTLTAKVTSATITPVGTVTFTDTSMSPAVALGSATLSGGVATLPTTSTALVGVGTHLIVASYNPPPSTFAPSSSPVNAPPTVTITGPPSGDVDAVSTIVNFTGTYSPAGGSSTAQWSFASSDTTAAVAGLVNTTTGVITGSYPFPAAGVYAVTLTVNDGLGGITIANAVTSTGLPASVVVYDPSAGFVTGGGWINSPLGAYTPNPALTGKASFGFVSKYQKGTTIPTGETQFTFQVANFDFHSTVYQWLVVSGPMAQYKGSGTINGAGNYNFLLTGRDGGLAGGNTPDGFRIKITDPVSGATIYDNLLSTDNSVTSANTQALGGGSIMIHSK